MPQSDVQHGRRGAGGSATTAGRGASTEQGIASGGAERRHIVAVRNGLLGGSGAAVGSTGGGHRAQDRV